MASRFGQAGVLAPLMSFFCVINNDHINGTIVTGTAIISLLTSHPENVSVFSKIVDWKVLKGLLDKRRADVLLVTIKILSILLRIRDNRKKLLKISGGFESLNQHLTTNNVPQRLAMMELMCNFYYEKGPVIEVVKGLDLENKVVRMASSNNEALVVSSHNCILNYSFSTTTVNKMSSTMLKSFATICLQKITNSLAEVESNAVQLKVVLSALTNFVANNHSIMLKLVHPQLKDILALIDSESLRPTCFSLLLELVKQGSIKSKDSLRIWKVLKGYFKSIIETERIFSFQILNEIEKKAPLALKQPTDEQSHFFTALASSIAFSYMNLFEMQAALVLLEQILAPLNARSSPDIDFEKSYTIICYSGITNALVMCIDEALRNEELYQLVNQLLGRILVQITEYQVACELITASPQVELVFVFLKKLDAQFNEDVEIKVKNNIVKERS